MEPITFTQLLKLIAPYLLTGGLSATITALGVLVLIRAQKKKADADAEKAEADSAESIGDSLEKLVNRCARLAIQLTINDEKHAVEIEKIKRGCAEEIEHLQQMYDADKKKLRDEIELLQAELKEFKQKVG